jgi:hypothetical protein
VILRLLASAIRGMLEEYGDVVRVMLDTAPHDQAAAEIDRAANLEAAASDPRQSFHSARPSDRGLGWPTDITKVV